MAVESSADLHRQVAYHDAVIEDFGRRLTGVERHIQTLQNDTNAGFAALSSKLDKLDARPTFNVHEIVRTAQSIGMTVGLVVAGIIWIVNGSFSGTVAEQKALNTAVIEKLKEQRSDLDKIAERLPWLTSSRVEPAPKRN